MPDKFETNDDAGTQAHTLWGKKSSLTATLDYYDDPVDVYRVALGPHERLTAKVNGSWAGAQVRLTLWRPGTQAVEMPRQTGLRAAQSASPGARQHLTFTVSRRAAGTTSRSRSRRRDSARTR